MQVALRIFSKQLVSLQAQIVVDCRGHLLGRKILRARVQASRFSHL